MTKNKTTFLDLPLEKDLYVHRPLFREKPPIKVLITDADQRFVYCLIYKICTGEVFGDNQDVYIHLVHSKGLIHPKSIFFEFEECGFHLLKGWVVTSDVEEAYSKVDVVVLTTSSEERSGLSFKEAIASRLIKARKMMRNIASFCKPSVRVVFVGPSTKFSLALLQIMGILEPRIPARNMTVVTLLDEAIARATLAARMRTTTNKIKNIVIWGMTCPDVHNATVRMFPKNDLGALEEVEVPVHEALGDDKYLHGDFVESIFRRKIGYEFSRSGKSLAIATARHLRALYKGAENGEIISMGVLTPSSEPFSVPQGYPCSFPVEVPGNGSWIIREDLKYDVRTHLNLHRSINRIVNNHGIYMLLEPLHYILDFEENQSDVVRISQRQELSEKIGIPRWHGRYFLESLPEEAIPKFGPPLKSKKSIGWDDLAFDEKDSFERKSSIKFGFKVAERSRTSSILKHFHKEKIVLPLI